MKPTSNAQHRQAVPDQERGSTTLGAFPRGTTTWKLAVEKWDGRLRVDLRAWWDEGRKPTRTCLSFREASDLREFAEMLHRAADMLDTSTAEGKG